MPTRRFRKRGGACPENPEDCTMLQKATGFFSSKVSDAKKAAEDASQKVGSLLGPSTAAPTQGGRRRRTKRKLAKRRTRR